MKICPTFCLVLTLVTLVSSQQTCPKGFIRHGFSCYKILDEIASWLVSMDFCHAFDMELVSIDSQDEHNFIKNYLTTHHANYSRADDFWTAGSTILSSDWRWAGSGVKINKFYWSPGEPNNPSTESCLSYLAHEHFLWNDEGCSKGGYPICERALK